MSFLRQCLSYRPPLLRFNRRALKTPIFARAFQSSTRHDVLKPFILPDIGEGMKEVQIIQWFVGPEARVEQFDKLCEVQSDKAATEVRKFKRWVESNNVEVDAKALTDHIKVRWGDQKATLCGGGDGAGGEGEGAEEIKPLCDIDVGSEPPDEGLEAEAVPFLPKQAGSPESPQKAVEHHSHRHGNTGNPWRHANLATPAVRSLLKELKVDMTLVTGTGRDGRVLKEDVRNYVAAQEKSTATIPSTFSGSYPSTDFPKQAEDLISLSPIQSQMFKTMTRSLQIPHFLYADEIGISSLSALRRRLNAHPSSLQKLSALPFIIKAVSLALLDYPLLNARIETGDGSESAKIIMRAQHNIGVAMDTPQGLLVPNIKNVGSLSITGIGAELSRLQSLAQTSRLSTTDLAHGTITVSNIGSIGGTYVSPIIVSNEVAILGVGKARTIPSFDEEGRLVKREIVNFSWSADHRIVDGATMARMAEKVRGFVEEPGWMLVKGR